MEGSDETRIVLLGKTGTGKSSLGNTILGESLLKTKNGPKSVTEECQAESKVINGVCTTVIDGPGLFDTRGEEEGLSPENINSLKQWPPGPHAFLIVLEVGRYSPQERDVINKILEHFSEEALKHAVVVFTHGDQLSEGETIKEFVGQDEALSELVEKCGGRCHVVDNKYWNNDQQDDYRNNDQQDDYRNNDQQDDYRNNDQQDDYRNNKFQVAQLLNTIETMKKSQGFYSNEFLKIAEKDKSGKIWKILAGVTVGVVLGALFGCTLGPEIAAVIGLGCKMSYLAAGVIGGTAGAVVGASIGISSETPQEAVRETAKALGCVNKEAKTFKIANSTQKKYK